MRRFVGRTAAITGGAGGIGTAICRRLASEGAFVWIVDTDANLCSRSSHRGDGPEHLAYSAAKGGLLALTKGIARGYGAQGVLAYALAPGWARTAMAGDHIASVGEEEVTKDLALREATPPGDVAAMVAFLASGRCRHATGSTIDITGADYVR